MAKRLRKRLDKRTTQDVIDKYSLVANSSYGKTIPTVIEARETLAALIDIPSPSIHSAPYFGLGAEQKHDPGKGDLFQLRDRMPRRAPAPEPATVEPTPADPVDWPAVAQQWRTLAAQTPGLLEAWDRMMSEHPAWPHRRKP